MCFGCPQRQLIMPEPVKTASITVNILWKGQLMPSEQFLMRLATPTNQYLTLYCDQNTQKLARQGMLWVRNGNCLCQKPIGQHQFPFIYYMKANCCPGDQYSTRYCDQTSPKWTHQGMCIVHNGNWLCKCKNPFGQHQFMFIYYGKSNWRPWSCFWCSCPPQRTDSDR